LQLITQAKLEFGQLQQNQLLQQTTEPVWDELERSPERILMKFYILREVADIINAASFSVDRKRDFVSARV
jgi:hypothetical protein